jgi:hypothetical protein
MKVIGMDMRKAINLAKKLKCEVRVARRTGEYVLRDEEGRRCRVNLRRKDSPRSLSRFLRRLLPEEPLLTQYGDEPNVPDIEEAEEPAIEADLTTFEEMVGEWERVQADVVAPATTVSIQDRLAAWSAEREALVTELRSRQAALDSDHRDLLEMIENTRREREHVESALKSLGGHTEPASFPAPVVTGPNGHVPADERQRIEIRLRDMFSEKRGIWLTPGDISRTIGIKSPSSLLSRWVEAGEIEKRGNTRGAMYRLPALQPK